MCSKVYVGETSRPTIQRLKEHKMTNNKNDAVIQHFSRHHSGYEIMFDWEILHYNLNNVKKRKILESMYIKRVPPDTIMNGCTGYELPFNLN